MSRTAPRRARIVTRHRPRRPWASGSLLALSLIVAACGADGQDVERSSSSTSAVTVAGDTATSTDDLDATTTSRAGGPRTTDVSDTVLTTTSTSAAPTTTTTAITTPPTTAAPTTAAPTTAPPTTTAPPPPPTTTTTTAPPPPPTTTTAPPPSGSPQYGTRNTGCEQYMFNEINKARANVGAGQMQFDTGIHFIAMDWSDEMARSQTLKHNPNYAAQIAQVRNYRYAAENVGRGYNNDTLFQAFMNSPGHRKNIENPNYTHVTVACLNDSGGQLWVTQNFWGG